MLITENQRALTAPKKTTRTKLLVGFLGNYNSANTRSAYKLDLEEFFEFLKDQFHREKIQINEVNVEHAHLVVFKESLKRKQYSHSTINRKIAACSTYIEYLCEENLRRDNPFQRVKRFQGIEPGKTPSLSKEELIVAISKLDNSRPGDVLAYAICQTMFTTGIRVSGLCDLKLKDINNDRDGVYVSFISKGGKIEKSYLPSKAIMAIKKYLKLRTDLKGELLKEDYLFVSFANGAAKRLHRSSVNKMFDRIFKQLEELGISPHSARAYFITEVIKKRGIREAQERGHHSRIETTTIYDRNKYSGAIENLV